jgi:hypothetical protein
MAKNKKTAVSKTEEELLDERKRAAFEAFQTLNYDTLSPERRELCARELYETMAERPTPPTLDIPYDFWKEYNDTDEIKEVKRFIADVDRIFENLPQNPTKESWLGKERGIISNMKREWKTKLDRFKNERIMKEVLEKNLNEIIRKPENKDKNFSVNVSEMMQKALANIEETAYKPTRAKIEEIEGEIKKRIK